MLTKLGIVYEQASGELRRIVVPNDDAELVSVHAQCVSAEEAMLIADLEPLCLSENVLSDALIRAALKDHIK